MYTYTVMYQDRTYKSSLVNIILTALHIHVQLCVHDVDMTILRTIK